MRKKLKKNLMSTANFASYVTFWWMNGFFKYGFNHKLEETDMIELEHKDSSTEICSKLEREWRKELEQAKDSPSLARAVLKAYGVKYALFGVVVLLEESLRIGTSALTYGILLYLEEPEGTPQWYAYAYAIATSICVITIGSIHHIYFYHMQRMGWHLRAAACSMMYKKTLRLSQRSLVQTSTGQIVNLGATDVLRFDWIFGMLISGLILSSIVNYFVIIIVIPLIIYFCWITRYFLRTSRDIKRLEGTFRSPVFSLLSSTLQGLTTVRAFKMQDQFEEKFHEHQDLHSSSWFLFLCGQRWLGFRLNLISAIFTSCVALFSLLANTFLGLNPGEIGLIITYTIGVLNSLQWGVRQSAETENLMTSVERVQQYCHLPTEAPDEVPDKKPPQEWPRHGAIKFENVSFSYFKDGPIVLQNLNLEIQANEKIGIVGRTGAGKSSLISALFRFSELVEGEIYIDGIPISPLGLNDLRRSFSIIPQDPVLFTGTLQRNLDPFSLYKDEELWGALEQVQLKEVADSLPLKLQTELVESGSNFSVGQRQLFCLARALLRKSRILIIDEATANVDIRTDRLIQKTIREKFVNCTVLTIAHRLNTIIDSDRVLVIDTGRVKEFDMPHILLKHRDGDFTKMIKSTGISETKALEAAALEAFEARNAERIPHEQKH